MYLFEPIQCVTQSGQLFYMVIGQVDREGIETVVQRNMFCATTAFETFTIACVITEDVTHGFGRNREEMAATFRNYGALIYQLNVGFMDNRRCV